MKRYEGQAHFHSHLRDLLPDKLRWIPLQRLDCSEGAPLFPLAVKPCDAHVSKLITAMTISKERFWTRKDVARILEVSVSTARLLETHLGLDKAKVVITRRTVRYRTSIAIRQLQKLHADLGPFPEGCTLSRHITKTYAKSIQ